MISMTVPYDRGSQATFRKCHSFSITVILPFSSISAYTYSIDRIFVDHTPLSLVQFIHNFQMAIQELTMPSLNNVVTYQIAIHFRHFFIDVSGCMG